MRRKIRILLISTNSDLAGAPIHVQYVAEGLRNQVKFCAIFGEDGPVCANLNALGVRTVVVDEMRSSISPFRDLIALKKLAYELCQFEPDLIHMHSTKAGMLGRLLGFFFNVPTIYTVHGWGWRGLPKLSSKLVMLIEKLLSRIRNSCYIYVSSSVQSEAFHVLGLSGDRGEVIYNGVRDIAGKADCSGVFTLMMPARVSSAKDHESLVKAFDHLKGDVHLVLCGGGTNDPSFISKLQNWAPSKFNKITCMGEFADIPSLLHSSDVFLLISNYEALPLSIIEAMSASKAIIATDVGGVSELIQNGVSGILVEKNNIDNLCGAMNTMLDPEIRKNFGDSARSAYLMRFTDRLMLDAIYRYYIKIYRRYHNAH